MTAHTDACDARDRLSDARCTLPAGHVDGVGTAHWDRSDPHGVVVSWPAEGDVRREAILGGTDESRLCWRADHAGSAQPCNEPAVRGGLCKRHAREFDVG